MRAWLSPALQVPGLLALLAAMAISVPAAAGSEWPELAARLSGESDTARARVLRDLRKIPELEARLREELRRRPATQRTFLALDVISALGVRSLLGELQRQSETDETGYFYHAINTLITPEDLPAIRALYRERLKSSRSSAPAKVALVDSLGRLAVPLEESLIERLLLKDASHEVRSAALYYLRHFTVKLEEPGYLSLLPSLLPKALDLSDSPGPYQLRLQTLYLLSELPPAWRQRSARILSHCRNDPEPRVRELCLRLSKEAGR